MSRRWLAIVLAAALAVAGWFGWRAWQGRTAGAPVAVQDVPSEAASGPETIQTVATDAVGASIAGATPMRQRVATLGLLNKRNGQARDLTLRPGQMIRVGDVVIHLRACDRTAPWEADQLTGAFVQVDVRGVDQQWRRPFSGWLFKERPNLNLVQHPVYDVWTKSCTMSFPDKGPDTEVLTAPASSAKKSPGKRSAVPVAAEAPTTPDNASPSDTR